MEQNSLLYLIVPFILLWKSLSAEGCLEVKFINLVENSAFLTSEINLVQDSVLHSALLSASLSDYGDPLGAGLSVRYSLLSLVRS